MLGVRGMSLHSGYNDLYDQFTASKKESFKSQSSVAIVSRHARRYKTTKGFSILGKKGLRTKKSAFPPAYHFATFLLAYQVTS